VKFGGYPMKAISFMKVIYNICDGNRLMCCVYVELSSDGACWKAYL